MTKETLPNDNMICQSILTKQLALISLLESGGHCYEYK